MLLRLSSILLCIDAASSEALERAFGEMHAWKASGLVVLPDVMFWQRRSEIAKFAEEAVQG